MEGFPYLETWNYIFIRLISLTLVIIHSTFISIILIGELKDGLFVKGKPEVIRNAEQIFEIFVHGQVLISLDTLAPAKYKSSSGDSELGNYSRASLILSSLILRDTSRFVLFCSFQKPNSAISHTTLRVEKVNYGVHQWICEGQYKCHIINIHIYPRFSRP